jgi:hypothetical protein
MNDDAQNLRYLTIGHYICAAIAALFACIPLIHFSIWLVFLLKPPAPQDGEQFPAQLFGLMFALIGGAAVLCGWAFAALIFVAGRFLAARRRHTFCIVVAALRLRVLPVRNGAGGLHDTGLDAAYGQGNVPATVGSWRSTGERSGTWRMARRNLH